MSPRVDAEDKHQGKEDESAQLLIEQTKRRIEEILQRPPPSIERIEELSAASRRFYLESMERKRKRERKQLAAVLAVLIAPAAVWYRWFR